MPIDLASEEVRPLGQAARHFLPGIRGGKSLHPSTIFRWASAGVRGVKLETIRVGGVLYTSREAIQRFSDALTAGPEAEAVAIRTPASRRKAVDRAVGECVRLGV